MPSLHQKIRNNIEGRIHSGELKPGDRIPFEHELMAEYGCSRMTVSKALGALSQAGLIDRRRKAGSFVRSPRLEAPLLNIPDIEVEVKARGEPYRFDLLSRSAYEAFRPDEIELAGKGGRILYLSGVHYASGRPLAVEQRLINLTAAPKAERVDFNDRSPGHWLLEAVDWTEAENRVSAESADPETARLLRVPRGHACLVVMRRTWRGEQRITGVRQAFDGHAYFLTERFHSHRG